MQKETMKLIIFFMILLLAAIYDIKKRIVPNQMVLLTMTVSLIPPSKVFIGGVFAAMPLLLAGMMIGGIGGGDIKLTGACGMVLGFSKAFQGILIGLCLLVMFDIISRIIKIAKGRSKKTAEGQAYPLVPFLVMGMLVSIGIGG